MRDPEAEHRGWTPRAVIWLVVRLGVAAAVLAFTLSRMPLADLAEALGRLTLVPFVVAVGAFAATNLVGALRWRMALVAFGARTLPPYLEQVRLYFVGMFFNTYVPGGLGGDVLRAGLSQRAVGSPTAAWASVLVERVLGLAALFTFVAVGLATGPPMEGVRPELFVAAAGVLGLGGVLSPILLRPMAKRWDLGTLRALPLIGTYLVSLVAHALVAFAGYVLALSIAPDATLQDSLVVVPLAQAAVFFPATVGGLGVREAAFVELYRRVGVPTADAGGVAFAFLAMSLSAAAIGGLVHVFVPRLHGVDEVDEDETA